MKKNNWKKKSFIALFVCFTLLICGGCGCGDCEREVHYGYTSEDMIKKYQVSYSDEKKTTPIEENDVVVIDIECYVDGKPMDILTRENEKVEIGDKWFFESELFPELIGKTKGDKVEVNFKFDIKNTSGLEEWNGKDAIYKATIKEVYFLAKPSDELAQKIANDMDSDSDEDVKNIKTWQDFEEYWSFLENPGKE